MKKILAVCKRHIKCFLIGCAFVVICLVILEAALVPLSSSSKFCGSCHEMEGAYESWLSSAHHSNKNGISVACTACHLPPQEKYFRHRTVKAWAGVRDIFMHFFGGEYEEQRSQQKVIDTLPNEWCVYCHNNLLEQPGSTAVAKVHQKSLSQPEEINYRCVKCHDNLHGKKMTTITSATNEKADKEPPEPADNYYCYVCHNNFDGEELTLEHELVGVGCEKCHGISDKHSADEDGITPPDIMYSKEMINSFCISCHPEKELAEQMGHKPFLALAETARGYCTDCHGSHQMEVRTRRWDKQTRKLIWDDGVRMMKDDSPPAQK